MNRSNCIKKVADFKETIILHKESIKKAALPVTVAAALLFFWIGGGDEKEIEEADKPVSEIMYESNQSVESEDNDVMEVNTEIFVDIGGCINNPGVYKIKDGTRLFEVIEKAGGLTDDADTNSINQAEQVYDGQKIIINSISNNQNETAGLTSGYSSNGSININYADSTTLQEIPGVGPSTAQKIIEYRETVGKFKTIEDIKNISGIGDKTFENMKDYITV